MNVLNLKLDLLDVDLNHVKYDLTNSDMMYLVDCVHELQNAQEALTNLFNQQQIAIENYIAVQNYIDRNGETKTIKDLIGTEGFFASIGHGIVRFIRWICELIKKIFRYFHRIFMKIKIFISNAGINLLIKFASPNPPKEANSMTSKPIIDKDFDSRNSTDSFMHKKIEGFINLPFNLLAIVTKSNELLQYQQDLMKYGSSKRLLISENIHGDLVLDNEVEEQTSKYGEMTESFIDLVYHDKNGWYTDASERVINVYKLLSAFGTGLVTQSQAISSMLERLDEKMTRINSLINSNKDYTHGELVRFQKDIMSVFDSYVSYTNDRIKATIAVMTQKELDTNLKSDYEYKSKYNLKQFQQFTNLYKQIMLFFTAVATKLSKVDTSTVYVMKLTKDEYNKVSSDSSKKYFDKKYELPSEFVQLLKRLYDRQHFRNHVMNTIEELTELKSQIKADIKNGNKESAKRNAQLYVSKYNQYCDKFSHSTVFKLKYIHVSSMYDNASPSDLESGNIEGKYNEFNAAAVLSGQIVIISAAKIKYQLIDKMNGLNKLITNHFQNRFAFKNSGKIDAPWTTFAKIMLHEFKHSYFGQNNIAQDIKLASVHPDIKDSKKYDKYGSIYDEYEADLAAREFGYMKEIQEYMNKFALAVAKDMNIDMN